ncbi:MAG: hypothetical protein FWE98_04205 [Oscillospiraceae bacterium]|nr:hypothetical protein [Oscillospiraceae bacterium]
MKRLLTAALSSLCLLALCACGQAAPPEATTPALPATEATTTKQTTTTQPPTMPPIEYPASYKDAPAAYKPVLDNLYALKQWLWNDETDWPDYYWDTILDFQYAEAIMGAWNYPVSGYVVADINNDGVPELLLFGGPDLRSLFTLSDGQPISLGSFGPRSWGYIAADGTVHHGGSGSAASGGSEIYRLEPYATTLTLVVGHNYDHWPPEEEDTYYKIIDGERVIIDEKAYNAIVKQHKDPEKHPLKFTFIPIEQ